jgi:hypothetical protein
VDDSSKVLLIKPGARVETIWPDRGVWVRGTLLAVECGGRLGYVRLDSTGRSYLAPAAEIVKF